MASVLIAGMSGRALAQAARAGGYLPLVADQFADQDTQAAARTVVVPDLSEGALLPALATLSRGYAPIGVVTGAGFEDRPDLLGAIGRHYRIIGNDGECVRAVKHPPTFAAACAAAGLDHPALHIAGAPASGDDRNHEADGDAQADPGARWLRKRIGGAGGLHITAADPAAPPGEGCYVQRRVAGTPFGALFAADGRRARILGLSRQWTDPAPAAPFRFGGAAQPATLPAAMHAALAAGLDALVARFGLRGLNSADLLVRADGFSLLEINPRPGATLDLFPHAGLFGVHLRASRGELPAAALVARPSATAIVYAPASLRLPAAFPWPAGSSDRGQPGIAIQAGQPLCSVQAGATTVTGAIDAVRARRATILAAMEDIACQSA